MAEQGEPLNSPDIPRLPLSTALRVCSLSWKEYRITSASPAALLSTVIRVGFQVAFFTFLGQLANGDTGRTYAFFGAVAFAPVPAVVSHVPAVMAGEVPQGTMYRLRLGNAPLLAIMVLRSWVYLVEGVAAACLALFLLGPAVLGWPDTLRAAVGLPVVLLTTLSCLCAGLFCCVLVLMRLDEGLVVNSCGYLILICSGAIVPVGTGSVLHPIGQALPLGAGLRAFRAGGTDQLLTAALNEAAVAALWLLATYLLLRFHERRVRSGATPEPV